MIVIEYHGDRILPRGTKKGFVYAQPEIINSDQGSQFTREDWVDYLDGWGIDISMTGKGRCLDNVY